MTYNRINTNNVKLEMDFEQIQSDLKKFKNQKSVHEIDDAKLLRYIDKLERLITDENYQDFEYIALLRAASHPAESFQASSLSWLPKKGHHSQSPLLQIPMLSACKS